MGCILARGIGRLRTTHGNATNENDQEIFNFCMIPPARHLFSNGHFLFMQDNAPDTSGKQRKVLYDSDVDVMGWPGPDLNP